MSTGQLLTPWREGPSKCGRIHQYTILRPVSVLNKNWTWFDAINVFSKMQTNISRFYNCPTRINYVPVPRPSGTSSNQKCLHDPPQCLGGTALIFWSHLWSFLIWITVIPLQIMNHSYPTYNLQCHCIRMKFHPARVVPRCERIAKAKNSHTWENEKIKSVSFI